MKEKRGDMNHNQEKIIRELKENSRGFTVSELSKKLGVSRQTVTNCFAFLEGAEKVKTRQTGMARIYFWTKRGERKMKKTFLISISMLVSILTINIISVISTSDVLVWQGQYYTGAAFNTGTYEFNFTIYDALTGGNICYSNTTALTTGSFGEWKTEQSGVGSACSNVSKDYYLNINIDGIDQTPRRRLVVWNFLRKDVDEITSGTFQANTQVVAPVIQANTQLIAPIVNATQLMANEITISSNANIFGVLRGHSPLKIGDSIQFIDMNDSNLFSVYTAGQNITGSNVSSQYYGVIIHQIDSHTNPSGIEECWWDREDQEMRMCMDRTSIEIWNNLSVRKNVNITGNASAETGFFSYLGSLVNRITKLWVVDINATGNIETSENVSAKYFIGNGSLLTNLPAVSLAPVYLGSDLNATSATYATIFNITLTPGKMNIVQAYLAQSSPTNGVAIQNRVIVSESGPVGYCNFVTQTGGADAVDTIAVGTSSADTGETTMSLDTNVPFMNTVTCTVIADANQKNLIIQFDSETATNVTTYAGSYYTNAVN